MKQHVEFVAKVANIKETKTAKGYLYSFSIPLAKMEEEVQLTEWLQCSVFLKEQDKRILKHTGEFHFTGTLGVKKAYKDYPQGLSFFGFVLEPVLGNVYRIVKPKPEAKESDFPEPSASVPF